MWNINIDLVKYDKDTKVNNMLMILQARDVLFLLIDLLE